MAKVLGKDRKYIILNNNKDLQDENLKYFKRLIKERSSRKPIAHLINKKFFWNSEFFVTSDTLIPRPDTELVIEHILKLSKHKNTMSILDIGIGSGCILLTILKERKSFYGTGIDISKNCLNISKINAKNLKVEARTKLYKTDVDKFCFGKYDLIVSNPPYISKFDLKYLEIDVAKYEPRLALDGGLDGLSEIRKVIKKSSELIKRNGKFILEIGFDQKNKVINLLKKEGFYINSTSKDLAKNDRCIVSTKI
jgi:release factor glutamine methyltransferase